MQQISTISPNTGPSNPATIHYFPAQSTSYIVERYMKRHSLILGISQVIIGILCIIFNAVSLGLSYVGLGSVGHGFWCGILYIVTGTFGIRASQLSTKCNIVAFMVLCIISACSTIALVVCGIIGATTSSAYCYYYGNSFDYSYNYPSYQRSVGKCYDVYQAIVAMQALLAICGFIEAIIAIWGSVICCKSGVCGCCNQVPMVVIPAVGYLPNNGQTLCVTQGGQYAYSSGPMMSYSQGPLPAYVTSEWTTNQPQMQPTTASAPIFGQPPPSYFASSGINQSTEKTTYGNF